MGRIYRWVFGNRLVLVLILVLLTVLFMALQTWVAWLFPIVVGGIVGVLVASGHNLRSVYYTRGYMRARAELFSSMDEAGRRGMTIGDWVQGELERQQSFLFDMMSKKDRKAFLEAARQLAQQGDHDGGDGDGNHQ